MKKMLFILFAFCAIGAQAQSWKSIPVKFSVTGDDTATNTDVILLTTTTPLTDKYDVNVDLATVRVSGTLAATVYCQGSNDGTTWYTLKVSTTVSPSVTDTATIANAATGSATFAYRSFPYKHFRVSYNSSNTGVSAPTIAVYARKADD